MTKNLFSKLGLLSMAVLASAGLQAQTVVWGAGATVFPASDPIGRFVADTATTANYTPVDSIAALGWTNQTNSPWFWSSDGISQSSDTRTRLGANPVINAAASAADGLALFDSDFLGYHYADTIFTPGPPQTGYLVSPSIDLTGYADSLVFISFNTGYLDFNATKELQVSTDGGSTWSQGIDIKGITGVGGGTVHFAGEVSVNISNILSGAASLTDVQFRFYFTGDSWYWAIDDVRIETAEPFTDLAIGGTDPNPSTLGESFSTVKFSNYFSTPMSQIDAKNFHYGARVRNTGTIDVAAGDTTLFILDVEFFDGTNFINEYNDTIVYTEEIVAGSTDTFLIKQSIDWVPSQVGFYRATYRLELADDSNAGNNVFEQEFQITENYFSHVAPTVEGTPSITNTVLPAGTNFTEYEYGSMYFFPNGPMASNKQYQFDSVVYRPVLPRSTQIIGGVSEIVVNARIYEYKDSLGDGFDNAGTNNIDLNLVALGVDSIPTSLAQAGAVTPLTRKFENFQNIVDIDNPYALKANQIYFITFDQRNPNMFDVSGGTTLYNVVFIGGNSNENYSLNFSSHSDDASFAYPSPLRIAGATNDWNTIGFGADLIPSAHIYFGEHNLTSVEFVQNAVEIEMNIFPNPVSDILNLSINFAEEVPAVQYILTDMTGRVLNLTSSRNITEERIQMNVSNLPVGAYNFSVKVGDQVTTKRFIKR